jgi:GTPase SAR1 family protein
MNLQKECYTTGNVTRYFIYSCWYCGDKSSFFKKWLANKKFLGLTMTKIVLIGPRNSGKSALAMRLVQDEFSDTQVKHTSSQCFQQSFDSVEIGRISQYFWDIECNATTMLMFLKNADIVLCLFSLAHQGGLKALQKQVFGQGEFSALLQSEQLSVCLVGTHADLPIAIAEQEIALLQKQYGIDNYFSVSAKSGVNISLLQGFLKHSCIRLFNNKSEQRKRLIAGELISKTTKREKMLEQAKQECQYLWFDEESTLHNMRAILHDYALKNNGWHLWFIHHPNRHHTWQVSKIVEKIDADIIRTADEAMTSIENIKNIRANGSLNLRLTFIKDKLGILDKQETMENENIEMPESADNNQGCCRLFS